MPHNLDFPPPNGSIPPICESFSVLTPTNKPGIQFKSLYHQVQKQQGLLPDFSGHRKSLHFSTTSSSKRQCSLRYVQYYQRPSKALEWNPKFVQMWHLLENVACILAGIMLNTATQHALKHIPIVAENHSSCNKMVGGPVEKCKSSGVLWHK